MGVLEVLAAQQGLADKQLAEQSQFAMNAWSGFMNNMIMHRAGNEVLDLVSKGQVEPKDVYSVAKKYGLGMQQLGDMVGLLKHSGALQAQQKYYRLRRDEGTGAVVKEERDFMPSEAPEDFTPGDATVSYPKPEDKVKMSMVNRDGSSRTVDVPRSQIEEYKKLGFFEGDYKQGREPAKPEKEDFVDIHRVLPNGSINTLSVRKNELQAYIAQGWALGKLQTAGKQTNKVPQTKEEAIDVVSKKIGSLYKTNVYKGTPTTSFRKMSQAEEQDAQSILNRYGLKIVRDIVSTDKKGKLLPKKDWKTTGYSIQPMSFQEGSQPYSAPQQQAQTAPARPVVPQAQPAKVSPKAGSSQIKTKFGDFTVEEE